MNNLYKVKIESITPKQQYDYAKRIAVQTHSFFQVFIKFQYLAIFHSYAELLHAARLESNPDVSTFTPQPVNIYVNDQRYVPDCFHIENGKQIITEIKKSPESRVKNRAAIEEKLNESDIAFRVIDNHSVLKDERELLNWLQIVRSLTLNKHLSTEEQENLIIEYKECNKEFQIFDLVIQDDTRQSFLYELAFIRLLYKHQLTMKDPQQRLNLGSWVQ